MPANDGHARTYTHENIPKAARMALRGLLPPKSIEINSPAGRRWLERAHARNKQALPHSPKGVEE